MKKLFDWAVIILMIVVLLFASVMILRAESVIEPVLITQDNDTYTLDYFLPYAKRISTSYSYKDGSLMSRVWIEKNANEGVYATHTYYGASLINDVQISVTLQDNSVITFTPRIVGTNANYLPLVEKNGTPVPTKPIQPIQCAITLLSTRIRGSCELANYDRAYVELYDGPNRFYHVYASRTFDFDIPYSNFTNASGYVADTETFAYSRILFVIDDKR